MANFPYLGEILSFITAILWASAVVLFKRSGETINPIGLNLFKDILSFILIMPTMWIFGDKLLYDAPLREYVLLFLSGVIGIGLADTFFFKSLNLLGAGLSAIVDCLYSPFVIILSVVFIGESMDSLQILGVFMIIFAVLTSTNPRHTSHIGRKQIISGIIYGVIAMIAISSSIVMIKPILDKEPMLWVTQIRTTGGILSLIVLLLFYPGRKKVLRQIVSLKNWRFMLPASILGNYLALIVWMGGMKYTEASIAAALNQTSNVFIIILAAIFLKEAITREKTIGIISATIGVFLVMFG